MALDKIPFVIASSNKGKVKEFRNLLSDFPLEFIDQPEGLNVEEIGQTFEENARIKAIAANEKTGFLSLADDSGLSVEALDGAPGIHSARYAKSDKERVDKILKELEPFSNRKAKFECALCIASNNKVLLEVTGSCEGSITFSPRGKNGFGYDPIFEVNGLGVTFAEMNHSRKKEIGHRGNAFKLIKSELEKLLLSLKH